MTVRTLSDDVHDLGAILGAVLREQAGPEAFALVESLRSTLVEQRRAGTDTTPVQERLSALSSMELETVVRAFGLYFNLVNLAEEHERLRRRKKSPGGGKQSLHAALAELKAQGHSADMVEALIASTPLLLTFTAHPTEMRRRTVREHLSAIAGSLNDLDACSRDASATADEDDARSVKERIAARVEALFGTAELRDRAPTVQDEVKGGLAYVSVLAAAMVDVEQSLRRAFATHFGRALQAPLPLGLHSWMGGDRDGNPTVTAEVTRETLAAHQKEADRLLRTELVALFAVVSQHQVRLGHGPGCTGPGSANTAAPATTAEPFRERIEAAVRALDSDPDFDPAKALDELSDLLVAAGQARTATSLLAPARCLARGLGRRLARLDVREHSLHIGRAVAELFKHAGIHDYAAGNESARRLLLENELRSRRPFLGVGELGGAEIEMVVGPLRVLRDRGLVDTRYIVSMTDEVSDILEVLIVAREAGVRVLPVPLFETLKDLEAGPSIMSALLRSPAYAQILSSCPTQVQEIMLGYSDSNKDAGPIAAVFGLYRAQQEIAAVCIDAGVGWRFFHGRGTSLGRGGGPLARAILGQPAGTIGSGLRLTEQGEALADKYGDPPLARRNLEQSLYGLLLAASRPIRVDESAREAEFLAAMAPAAASSRLAYRALVTDADFLRFFAAVTPIEEIARLKVASRPVRRHGQTPTLENLRAIPWVMSWTQNRLNLPGWYGADVAFAALGTELCRHMLATWPAFRSLLDNLQMTLATSDETIFRAYLSLDEAHSPLAGPVLESRTRTLQWVEDITEGPLLASEPHLLRSIALRNPYIEPIHRSQIELLRRSRRGQRTVVEDRALLSTILGIAAGVRNAG